jgi:hypothetical protein
MLADSVKAATANNVLHLSLIRMFLLKNKLRPGADDQMRHRMARSMPMNVIILISTSTVKETTEHRRSQPVLRGGRAAAAR